MKRKIHIVGNWKMNQSLEEIKVFFSELSTLKGHDCEAWVAPQFIHLPYALELAKKTGFVKVGAQNASHKDKGAFTGDISPLAIKELGCHFVIIGHSERRSFFKESHAILNEKTHLALKSGLTVIFCVGETLEEREAGKTLEVIKTQLVEGLKNISPTQLSQLQIAYEPVWAIGTGKVATPEIAQEVHAFTRTQLEEMFPGKSQEMIILYGGSVNPGNVAGLLSQKDIDGGLVGGASLKASDFKALCLNR